MSSEQGSEKGDEWVIGSQYAQLLGEAPSSFSSLIRALVIESTKGDSISFHSRTAMIRLLKGDSVRAPFYFAVRTFKKEQIQSPLNNAGLVALFKPFELASFLAILFLYRRTRSKVTDQNAWEFLCERIHPRAEMGTFVGQSMPNIGAGLGLLTGAARFLAVATFFIHDAPGFTEYRRHLKKEDLLSDLSYEKARWGCTHGNIAAHALISLGFGKEIAIPYGRGLQNEEFPDEGKGQYEYSVKLIEVWSTALLKTGKAPNIRHSGNFYPLKEALAKLESEAGLTRSSGSQFFWLDKLKADLNPDSAPELFAGETAADTSSSDSVNDESSDELS